MNLRDILAPIDALMKRHRIRYAVIGGYAVAAWGEVRATRDVDLLCSAKDLETLKFALSQSKLDFEHRIGDADDPISDVIRLRVGTTIAPYEVDFLAGIRGAPVDLLDRSREVSLDDLEVPVASPEDMIILKMLGGSARDLDDAHSIVRNQEGKLDLALIRRLCPEFLNQTCETLLIRESFS
ncbi:MAG: nucleotidyl transferase AbiEii/AbiGii toxin family protein [Acidobacteriota bacterium]|jgi:predicted nucleotidyltransferase